MTQVDPSENEVGNERRFSEKVQPWELIFLLALSASLLIAVSWQSRKEYFDNDELITAILVSNPNFSEMWHTIRMGGELNPPLFFVVEWAVARVFGATETALRAISGLSVALVVWVSYFTLRPLTGRFVAATAVAMIMGLSRDVFFFGRQARYYPLLFLLVSLGVFLIVRLTAGRPVRKRDCVHIFLLHLAMVYLHLYGLVYSVVLLLAMAVIDVLVRRQLRWNLIGSVVAAWICFGAWVPNMRAQFRAVSGGAYEPPNLRALGFFIEELALQIPFALVLLFIASLGGLALISGRGVRAVEETASCAAPMGWTALAIVSVGLLMVPVSTWLASLVMHPAPFIHRYIFPCTVAWIAVVALMLLAALRLSPKSSPFKFRLPSWFWTMAWLGVLGFCLGFQPMRAKKNPPRPVAAFVDADHGHTNLPVVFENSYYFIQRVVYGKGRDYRLLIDRDAAVADSGWYTKCMERFFALWYPKYHNARIAYVRDLPNDFIAMDDDYTKTFEWVFEHHPELKVQLLGTQKSPNEFYGQERIWRVQKMVPAR